MKKTLLFLSSLLGAMLPLKAANTSEWIDWSAIKHWAGDPEGDKKCALVIDFQDEWSEEALVWGYRWSGTATGEDLMRAVASQSSALTAMIQYTGSMGSTLNGLGISINRENLDHLQYDFDRAALAGEVSFGYFEPNTSMGQETAPGYATVDMCAKAIERAKTGGIIEHPLNAFVYGYPAYDYDYWKLADGYEGYDYRWRSGWYEGYWSYWHGPNDYDSMSYSGLGMSSIVLTDGHVQAWKYTPLNGGNYGATGDELAKELDYDILLYEEKMHEAAKPTQPVDQNNVTFWVGEGEKAATVVFQFNDARGPENLVYGYRWSGGWDDDLSTVIKNIADADPRMTYTTDGGSIQITYDSDCDGKLGAYDHTAVDNTWNCYVKRVVDEKFNKVPAARWLNPNAVMIVSHQSEEMAKVDLPYQLFRPALSDEPSVTLPAAIDYALADKDIEIPMFFQLPEGMKLNTAFYWTRSDAITKVTTGMSTKDYVGKFNGYKNFTPTVGSVSVRISVVPPGQTKAEYVYSNEAAINLRSPLRPITALHYAQTDVDGRLSHPIDNPVTFEPADATYTKLTYKSSNTKIATVNSTGGVTTTKTPGSALITASYSLDKNITASYGLTSSLKVPIQNITFDCADENEVITLTPKEMAGLFPVFTPEDPDINDISVTISGNGDGKENYIATMYQVNLWDENGTRTRPYELSGHRIGECRLTVSSLDGTNFSKEFTVRIVDPEREPAIDYNTGTIMLNEEWFGHTNGGLNWYSPEREIVYQAYERENPGMSFGATSQYGIVYDGKLIVCSKQAVDGGDPLPGGGRVVIADAATLKRLGSIDNLMWGSETKSNDGRACVGAGHGKAYVGSNSGIYIIDIEKAEIIGKVGESTLEGDDNGKPNTDPSSSLYSGQIGDMVLAGNHVFAIRQSTGVYVIDIDNDQIVKFIEDANVQGITQSADGEVWYATIDKEKLSNFVALDYNTFEETKRVVVPGEIGSVSCGWGAWRTTQFTGSHKVNALFFSPGSSISNGGAGLIYRYDIDEERFTALAKVSGLPAHTPGVLQGAYGTIRYDDRTGEIIAGTTESKASGHYRWNWTHFIDGATGEIKHTIALRPYYWFQAHAIFPDAYGPEMEDIDDITIDLSDEPMEMTLTAIDRDNNDANIRFSLIDAAPVDAAATATLEGNKLTITPQSTGEQTIGVAVESNGKIAHNSIKVFVTDKTSGVEDLLSRGRSIHADGCTITVSGYAGVEFILVNAAGQTVDCFTPNTDAFTHETSVAKGVYILFGSNGLTKKIIIK